MRPLTWSEILYSFSDTLKVSNVPQSVVHKLLTGISSHGRGYVFTPSEFLHVGSRAAVDQALSRLTKAGRIKRLARGVYVYPETNSLVGEVPPSPSLVAQALARAQGASTQLSEAAAANALGLTTQVPGRVVYLTNGAPRTRRVGNTVIQFKHASPRRLAGAGTPAGTVMQALRYVGRAGANEQTIERIREMLPRRQRRALREVLPFTPAWMRPAVQRIAAEHPHG